MVHYFMYYLCLWLEIVIFLSDLFFNNIEKEIDFFLEILDKNFDKYYKEGKFDKISYSCNDIYNNQIFIELKNSVFEFLED